MDFYFSKMNSVFKRIIIVWWFVICFVGYNFQITDSFCLPAGSISSNKITRRNISSRQRDCYFCHALTATSSTTTTWYAASRKRNININNNNAILLNLHATISSSSSSADDFDNNPTKNKDDRKRNRRRRQQQKIKEVWTDFKYGIQYVDSQYLKLFWKYCIRQTFMVLIPASLALLTIRYCLPTIGSSLYSILNQVLQLIFLISSFVGGILQLPLDLIRWVWHIFPIITIPTLDYLPNFIAIRIAKIMLFMQYELRGISQSYLFSAIAVAFWRPMIEEIQYRYLLFKLLDKPKRFLLMIPPWWSKEEEEVVVEEKEDSSNYLKNNQDSSILLSKDDEDLSSSSSSSTDVVNFIPLKDPTDEDQDKDDDDLTPSQETKSTTVESTDGNTGNNQNSSLKISRRALLSSLLFGTTRLGWLCALPDTVFMPSVWKVAFLQSATAPYIWTVGFIQSIVTHFSSSVMSELLPLIHVGLLLLALHQSISTYLVARHVFVPLYEQYGLPASIGAHIAWTIGKATLPFRVVRKIFTKPTKSSTAS